MSLSQKHFGKILTPWATIAEWKTVRELIYKIDSQDWPKALEILKVWKLRTPLLSAGVEGTFIVLEALLYNTDNKSENEVTNQYSTALLRFLNICAANNKKQGTFYTTTKKLGLPKWLIRLRHDIAHDHKVPSRFLLECSFKYCLDWLNDNYWSVQTMSEKLIDGKSNFKRLEDLVFVFMHLKNKSSVLPSDEEIDVRLSRVLKTSSQEQYNNRKMLEFVTCELVNKIKLNVKGAARNVSKLLLGSCAFLYVTLDENGNIPNDFIQSWSDLLNIFYQTELLIYFVESLFDYSCDEVCFHAYREVSSKWMFVIFQALIDKDQGNVNSNGLNFIGVNDCMKNKNFVCKVLSTPSCFTMNFVKEVLLYNNAPQDYIEKAVETISAYVTPADDTDDSEKIFPISVLDSDFITVSPDGEDMVVESESASFCQLIKDTTEYENLPLGVLPHQCDGCNFF